MKFQYRLSILICALTLVGLGLKAQVSVNSDTSRATCIDYGTTTDVHHDIMNNTGADTVISWEIKSTSLPSGWTISQVCDNINCFVNIAVGSKSTSATVATGTSMDMKVTFQLDASAVEGMGTALMEVGANRSDVINIVFAASTCGPQSVEIIDSKSFDVNYYSGNLKLILGTQSEAKTYRIYDIYGQTIADGKITDQIQQIQFERIPSVYIMQVLNKNGEQIETKKFTNY